ncbi:TonB-dependent receptor SusC, partial [termite gut metagenome]
MRNTSQRKPFRLWLTLLLLFPFCASFAQTITVKGIVKDSTGEPIIGASVIEAGSTNGTITDFNGN